MPTALRQSGTGSPADSVSRDVALFPVGTFIIMNENNLSPANIRVRFAPSPTGHLHIGGARTALFNWLFARHHDGTFVLRIEDTDMQRSTTDSRDAIIESLQWLGLDWDEGPFFQSGRTSLYASFAQKLVDEGKASLNRERQGAFPAVVLAKPAHPVAVDDLIHGRVQFEPDAVGELVLMKSDGTPTYNFACVVDDATMEISHIIRGDDHLSNTPKQVFLYQVLELKAPRFAHVPLILGPDGSRLSKRHGATAVSQFRDEGFLPEALSNYLALLGWSPGDDREKMSLSEIIAAFSLKRVSRKSAVFDTRKLQWLNDHYLREKDTDEIVRGALPFYEKEGIPAATVDAERLKRIITLLGERFKTLRDLTMQSYYFFSDEIRFDENAVRSILCSPEAEGYLITLIPRLEELDDFSPDAVENAMRSLIDELGVKPVKLIQPVRIALTGGTRSPGIFETMALLGKKRTLARLRKGLETCRIRQQ